MFCYLKGTKDLCLVYSVSNANNPMIGYSDANWAGDRDTRRSTSGYAFIVSGGLVSWNSKKQKIVALSTAEAEYVALSEACKETIWLRKLVQEVVGGRDKATIMYEDNQAAISMVKNPVHHARSKHIDIKFHYIRVFNRRGTLRSVIVPQVR